MYLESVKRMLPDDIKLRYMMDDFNQNELCEIRMRINKPVLFVYRDTKIEGRLITKDDIKRAVQVATNNSTYAYESSIKEGFITVNGGHRIGIGGQIVYENGVVKTFANINFLCIRIAKEIKGSAEDLLETFRQKGFKNTLIVGSPGYGKTTMLRDLVRGLSDEFGKNIVLIDERREIAACVNGVPSLEVGKFTDVYDGGAKKYGMLMAVRTMSPDVIALDEIGGSEEFTCVKECAKSGCFCIATIHGELDENLSEEGLFEKYEGFKRIIFLEKKGGIRRCLEC